MESKWYCLESSGYQLAQRYSKTTYLCISSLFTQFDLQCIYLSFSFRQLYHRLDSLASQCHLHSSSTFSPWRTPRSLDDEHSTVKKAFGYFFWFPCKSKESFSGFSQGYLKKSENTQNSKIVKITYAMTLKKAFFWLSSIQNYFQGGAAVSINCYVRL